MLCSKMYGNDIFLGYFLSDQTASSHAVGFPIQFPEMCCPLAATTKPNLKTWEAKTLAISGQNSSNWMKPSSSASKCFQSSCVHVDRNSAKKKTRFFLSCEERAK